MIKYVIHVDYFTVHVCKIENLEQTKPLKLRRPQGLFNTPYTRDGAMVKTNKHGRRPSSPPERSPSCLLYGRSKQKESGLLLRVFLDRPEQKNVFLVCFRLIGCVHLANGGGLSVHNSSRSADCEVIVLVLDRCLLFFEGGHAASGGDARVVPPDAFVICLSTGSFFLVEARRGGLSRTNGCLKTGRVL